MRLYVTPVDCTVDCKPLYTLVYSLVVFVGHADFLCVGGR